MDINPRGIDPLFAPKQTYHPTIDTITVRYNNEQSIIQEIFKRSNGTFGMRYQAWENVQERGDNLQLKWHEFIPNSSFVTDSTETAKQLAEYHAKKFGMTFGEWIAALPVIQK